MVYKAGKGTVVAVTVPIHLDENEQAIFTFGKHKGRAVDEVLEQEPGYFGWILNADFPLYTKKVLTQIKLSKLNSKL